jgi:hypothetical protein
MILDPAVQLYVRGFQLTTTICDVLAATRYVIHLRQTARMMRLLQGWVGEGGEVM